VTLGAAACVWLLSACDTSSNAAEQRGRAADASVTQLVSAFAPLVDGRCTPGYAAELGVCVHERFDAGSAVAGAALRESYARGARAPMLQLGAAEPLEDPRARLKALPPGALMAENKGDPAAAKRRRLAALDAMLARLRAEPAAPEKRSSGGGAEGEAKAPQGLQGKLEEMRRLVQRKPAEDTATLRAQMLRDGFTEDEIRGVVPEAR
jgi:hypothetical protein